MYFMLQKFWVCGLLVTGEFEGSGWIDWLSNISTL